MIASTEAKRELGLRDREEDSVAKPQQGGKWGISLLQSMLYSSNRVPFLKYKYENVMLQM